MRMDQPRSSLQQQQHNTAFLHPSHIASDSVLVRAPVRSLPASALVVQTPQWQVQPQQQQQQQLQRHLQSGEEQTRIQQQYEPTSGNKFSRFLNFLLTAAPASVVKSKEQREEEKFNGKEERLTKRIEAMEDQVTSELDKLCGMEQERYEQIKRDIEEKERAVLALRNDVLLKRPDKRPTEADILQATNILTSKVNLVQDLRQSSTALLAIEKARGEAAKYIHNHKKALRHARITRAAKRVSGDDENVEEELAVADDTIADMTGLNAICATFSTQAMAQDTAVDSKDSQISDLVRQLFAQPHSQQPSAPPQPAFVNAGPPALSVPVRPTAASISSSLLLPPAQRRVINYGQQQESPPEQADVAVAAV